MTVFSLSTSKFDQLKELLKNPFCYMVATALRGPDNENYPLKRLFTYKIREFLGLLEENSSYSVGTIAEAILKGIETHFLAHISEALGVLASIITKKEEFYFLDMLSFFLYNIEVCLTEIEKGYRIKERLEELDELFECLNKLLEDYSYFLSDY